MTADPPGRARAPREAAKPAPYRLIAADLRRRIGNGELPPGARVPSTRAITREYGVAMATATKVLTELRHAGLVRAVPGVGTVVATAGTRTDEDGAPAVRTNADGAPAVRTSRAAPPPSRPRAGTHGVPYTPGDSGSPALAAVVSAAIAIADAEGIDAVSMRRLAAHLGMATMSLYRHVRDKDDLVLRMMDAAFAGSPLPDALAGGWREHLERAARTLWVLFRRHPWLAPVLSLTRPQASPHAILYTEWVLAALTGHGLDGDTMFTIHLTLFNYVRGTAVNRESEAAAEAATGMDSDEWLDSQEAALEASLASGSFPAFRDLLAEGYDFDLDALFEFGLQRLLDGMAPLVTVPPRP